MTELLYLVFLVLLSLGIGRRALRWINIQLQPLEEVVFAFPLGISILAYIVFFIGLVGYLYKELVGGIFIALFVIFLRDVKKIVLEAKSFVEGGIEKKVWKRWKPNFSALLVLFLVLFAFANLVSSFAPPRHYDVLAYHLAVPKLYIENHSIYYIDYNFYSNLPFFVEIIYMIGLLLKNSVLANLISYTMVLTFMGAVYCFSRRFFSEEVAITSCTIFYTLPLVSRFASTTHVDLQSGFFIFLSVYSCLLFTERPQNNFLILSAIFGGLGIVSKIFGVVGAAGVGLVLATFYFQQIPKNSKQWKQAAYGLFIFCVIACIIVVPWLLKNYIFTQNPVWPIFNDFFRGKGWDQSHQENLKELIHRRELSIANYLLTPWDIHTQMGSERYNIDKGESIGPYLLAFLLLYFFLRRKHWVINICFFLMLFYLSIWFFLSYFLRYVSVILPLVAVGSAYVIIEISKLDRVLLRVTRMMIVFTLGFNMLIVMAMASKSFPLVIGAESEREYYENHVGGLYEASLFINEIVPESGKILLFRDNRGYFLERKYIWGDPLFQVVIDYSKVGSAQQLKDELLRRGITHVLVNTEFDWENVVVHELRYSEKIRRMMNETLVTYGEKIFDNGEVESYALR
jgi:hypothetical protein